MRFISPVPSMRFAFSDRDPIVWLSLIGWRRLSSACLRLMRRQSRKLRHAGISPGNEGWQLRGSNSVAGHVGCNNVGRHFADLPKNRLGPTARFRGHPSDRSCQKFGIEHRLTKPKHPWTNGQVERMNRTIKEATVKRFHYDTHDQLASHLADFVPAYNFARRLKTFKGLSPYEAIC